MKTWQAMYLIIWVAFLQILFILFSPLDKTVNVTVNVIIVIALLGLAFTIYSGVRLTSCPDRIKRITKATRSLVILQLVLGVALALGVVLSWGSLYISVMSFLHVANALAIITQASSSATAFDMWEEKEFQVPEAVK
jgi:signal transduction histidine kinase